MNWRLVFGYPFGELIVFEDISKFERGKDLYENLCLVKNENTTVRKVSGHAFSSEASVFKSVNCYAGNFIDFISPCFRYSSKCGGR